ncbi:MAG: hypothetical protein JXR37_07150 [Kiritimatiellae bacterium]|nr:hypothetical protein [Kiritimatiellia bacterium]
MQITFMGTGVGVYCPLTPGYRGFSALLVDDLLIDTPLTLLHGMREHRVAMDRVRNVAYTHAHSDHYDQGVLRQLVNRAAIQRILAPPRLAAKIRAALSDSGGGRPEVVAAKPGEPVVLGALEVVPLQANHTWVAGEPSLNYLVETDGGAALYMVDSALPLHETVQALKARGRPVDVLVMDATTVMDDAHRYMFVHGSLPSIARVARCWREMGLLAPSARVFGSHFGCEMMEARAPTADELAALELELPEDGMTISVGES